MWAPSRNGAYYQRFLQQVQDANPRGQIMIITDNLSSHNSKATRAWPEHHPRIRHAFIPKRACWLNLQEGWWWIFRRQALAGQSFADPDEIAHATRPATAHLHAPARPCTSGRPPPTPRTTPSTPPPHRPPPHPPPPRTPPPRPAPQTAPPPPIFRICHKPLCCGRRTQITKLAT